MIPTPLSEEANDDDHETSDQVITEPRRSTRVRSAPEWYSNPVLEVMLLDHDEPTNYEEAMIVGVKTGGSRVGGPKLCG